MKKIGLLGGMSWESTVPYYQTVNRVVGERLGGLHSAELLLHSVDFHEFERLQQDGLWQEAGERLAQAALGLESLGAELLVLCSNTMHRVAPQIEAALSIPLLHIADATATRVSATGIRRVGLLGTRFTMEESFYRDRLTAGHSLEVVVPNESDREVVHRTIYEELCRGRILETSRAEFRRVVAALLEAGCQGVVLGCTEIGLLLRPSDAPVPLFDTAEIHAEAAALLALESPPT
ncbi:MAG: aspartate/glutamate racemase family protein [Proteobacteria bacterium]|nr:aspartate/glutamate racemase family protein [Pseudomonadota bacterium]